MKLLSIAVVFFCLVIFKARALNFDKGAPKILIGIQVQPEYDLRNKGLDKLLGRYLSRYFQWRESRQGNEFEEVNNKKLMNSLHTIYPLVKELKTITETNSLRGIDLGNIVDKIKQNVQNLGQSVGVNLRNQKWLNICTEFDERPDCNIASD